MTPMQLMSSDRKIRESHNWPLMNPEALDTIPMKQFQILDFGILIGFKLVRVDYMIWDSWIMTIMKQVEIRHD